MVIICNYSTAESQMAAVQEMQYGASAGQKVGVRGGEPYPGKEWGSDVGGVKRGGQKTGEG